LVDLAGSEEVHSGPDHRISKGINQTLDQLSKMVLDKIKTNIINFHSTSVSVTDAVKKQRRTNPLFIFSKPLWTKSDTKIMMFACAKPYDRRVGEKLALNRDAKVLKALSLIQERQKEKINLEKTTT